jgi:hypothetical protein
MTEIDELRAENERLREVVLMRDKEIRAWERESNDARARLAVRLERAERAERRADRLRAFVSSQAITARALGAFDWERRMLDALHAHDRADIAANLGVDTSPIRSV